MDPNAALAEIRELTRDLSCSLSACGKPEHRLSELIEGLDRWLSRGGFLPSAWEADGFLPSAWDADRAASVRTAERAAIVGEIRTYAENAAGGSPRARQAVVSIINDVADYVNVQDGS